MVATMADTGFTARLDVSELVAGLRFVRPAAPARSFNRRGTAEVWLRVGDGRVFAESFNFEAYRRVALSDDVTGEGQVLVDALPLIAALGKAKGDAVVSFTADRVTVTVGALSFTAPTLDQDNKAVPVPMFTPDGDMFAGPRDELAEDVARVVVAASKDKTLPILTAVRVQSDAGRVTLTATDRYRMTELTKGAYTSDGAWTVPGRMLLDAIKAMPKRAWVQVTSAKVGNAPWTMVQTPGRTAGVVNIEGDYPAVERLWPDGWDRCITANTDALAAAVSAVASVAERNTPVVLDADGTTLVVRTCEGNGATLAVPVACQAVDEPVRVSFNPSFLSDALASVDGATVTLAIVHPNKPVVISSVTDPRYRYLLVPIRSAG